MKPWIVVAVIWFFCTTVCGWAAVPPTPKKIAGPLVVTIQMVAEAARFTYTERKVLSNFAQRFLPLDDVTSRENNRKSRSSGVQEADKNGNFPKPVQLQNSDGSANVVSTVAKAKPDMGILLYVAKNSTASLEQTVTTFWMSIVDLVKSFWFYAIAFIITVYAYRKLTSGLN
ncbi:hypothetical protein GH714_015500 [Hevea brasiliensis]|uniref:Uncharacterized protein n=1 Tax=Hevea brasiliensis TaxID=3981 RepID=A0A6A6LH17_HEVBR|nr:hypothetical protein GH714_015500 [Hevea brasiliensis]